jgi:membrane-associated phospholipid phosphatase
MNTDKFRKSVLIIWLIISFNCINYSQSIESNSSTLETSINNLSEGFLSSVNWIDIPIGAAYLGRNFINPNTIGDKIIFGPSRYENDYSMLVGKDNSYTIGSMDKDIIPNIIFYGRLTFLFLSDTFSENDISSDSYKELFLFKKSLIYTFTITEIVKNLVKRKRPDGSNDRSFFSGHTSTAFAASTYLALELNSFYNDWSLTRNNNPLRISFKIASFSVLYGWAGYVGYSRIKDKKHYLSDVLVGAAAGSLISYFIYDSNDNGIGENLNFTTYNGKDFYLNLGLNL